MEEYEQEKQLIDYLNVIWKKKWLILIPTFILCFAVEIYSFILPQIWEVDTIIQPSKFFIQSEGGGFQEVMVVDPQQIAGQINQMSYNPLIAAEFNIDIRGIPGIKAEKLKDTNLSRVEIETQDIEEAKSILYSLYNHLKREMDSKAENEISQITRRIETNKKKLSLLQQRIEEIENEMSDTKSRIELLEEEQRSNLKKENRSESESLAMLLYSNEIQESLRYYNTLKELLNNKKNEKENIKFGIESAEQNKKRIDFTTFIKEPTSTLNPVAPKKKRNVMLAGIIGLMIFGFLTFFLEYIEEQKKGVSNG